MRGLRTAVYRCGVERGGFPETAATEILEYLQEDGILRHTEAGGTGRTAPIRRKRSGLRSATADNVVVVDMTKSRNAVIGEMDRPSARELLFPRAIYIHLGRQYVVTSLDIEPARRSQKPRLITIRTRW